MDISRAGYHIRLFNAGRAVTQGRDAPGSAHPVNFVDIKKMGGRKNIGVERAVLSWGRTNGNALHTSHLGRNGVHQQAGNKGRVAALAAGHIKTHGIDRHNPLTENAAVRPCDEPGLLHLGLVESTDICGRRADLLPAFH